MGVDITHIVRNDFYDVENREASLKYVHDTIDLLKAKLALDEDLESFELVVDDEYHEITFQVPLYDVEFTLHNGFWQIESFVHYCQIVMHKGDKFWLRETISDIVRALGRDEVWHAEEFYTWNGSPIEEVTTPFESWLSYVKDKLGKDIPEYDYEAILAQGDAHMLEYEPVYHDSLKECEQKWESLADRLSVIGYTPLGVVDINEYVRCRRKSDNSIYLINLETLEPLTPYTPEAYYFDLFYPYFVVKRLGKYALFDRREMKQVSPFVSEPFRKEWNAEDNRYHVINEEADMK